MRIGTRGSPLALAQAHQVRDLLAARHDVPPADIEILIIRTSGDMIQDRALSESGGKGLFTKEIDQAQIEGRIDIAVHSSKDLPTLLPAALALGGFLPREDVRDAFISSKAQSLMDLPQGARIGTASLRRAAQLRRLRPDVQIVLLRGNVQTRLRKIAEGEADATLLALAGLKRLGMAHEATQILPLGDFLPAVGQGAIGVTIRANDSQSAARLAAICDEDTGLALETERAFLRVLDGSCRTPIAGFASMEAGEVHFRGLILRKDGSEVFETSITASPADAGQAGERAGHELLARAPADIFA
ncbi:MAG: hydroxymethylbilane synthase [Alphaproteobacteria bacterium]|nr:hydroxymethylbilane synthase [Alphaproteobacteria bacterium]